MSQQFTTPLNFSFVPHQLGLTDVAANDMTERLDDFAAQRWHRTDNEGRRRKLRNLLLELTPSASARTLQRSIGELMTQIMQADADINGYDEHLIKEEAGPQPDVNEDMDWADGNSMAGTDPPAVPDADGPPDGPPPPLLAAMVESRQPPERTCAEYDDQQSRYATVVAENRLLRHENEEQRREIKRLTNINDSSTAELKDLRGYRGGIQRLEAAFHTAVVATGAAVKQQTAGTGTTAGEGDDSGVDLDMD
ncbi:hypothetical protein LTR85_005902 [Meristemomyces frigidus]|nr:hypothetical protein LTR85_005902 [Meristemomyces frigidus]